MILQNKKFFVFDFDGVLSDSVDIKTDAFIKIFQEYDKKTYSKIIKHHIKNGGISRFHKFNLYFNEYLKLNLSENEIKKKINLFSKFVKNKVIDSNEIKGAKEILKFCKKNKIISIINTGTPTEEIIYILTKKKWIKYFDMVLGSPNSKEANFNLIYKHYNIKNKDLVFFGDSITDQKVAKKLSIQFVGINYKFKKNNNNTYYENFKELLIE